jgi:hypothetical protein
MEWPGAGVLLPAGRGVFTREVDGDGFVAAVAQGGHDEVPVPSTPATAVDERERRQRRGAIGRYRLDVMRGGTESRWEGSP